MLSVVHEPGGIMPKLTKLLVVALPLALACGSSESPEMDKTDQYSTEFFGRNRDGGSGGGSDGGSGSTLTITTTSPLPSANKGTYYNNYIVSTGGTAGTCLYTWTLVSGSLPAGLTLGTQYTVYETYINGTPTAVGTSNFTVQVRDCAGATARKSFSMTVNSASPMTITLPAAGALTQTGTVGQPFSQNLFASGGTQPYVWSATGLPPGLSVTKNGSTNVIAGTPTTAGTTTFTLTVHDSGSPQQQASQSNTITIN
jgi:large repetitive protein